jgi:hypothetical protein
MSLAAPVLGVAQPDSAKTRSRSAVVAPVHRAWRALGWFGGVLALVGGMDVLLVFYPARFGDPSWEFGVADSAVASLPLLVMGLAAPMASALAQQKKWQTRIVAGLCLFIGLGIFAGYVVYLTNVPMALRAAPPEVSVGIQKSIVRTTLMSVAFGASLIIGAIMAFRAVRTFSPRSSR